jgi:hypothetical protein
MPMKATSLTLALSACLSGCVPYPVYKTLQPAAHITVIDQANQALPRAEVVLIAYATPYGFEKSRVMKETTDNGTATFASVREWRAESLMIHGAQFFEWRWCVRKEGYVTYSSESRGSEDFQSSTIVRLERGESTPCPKPSR